MTAHEAHIIIAAMAERCDYQNAQGKQYLKWNARRAEALKKADIALRIGIDLEAQENAPLEMMEVKKK